MAHANGDPASDILPFEDVFVPGFALPTRKDPAPAKTLQLIATVKEAKKSGFPIKVALIGEPGDLGQALGLWQQPQRYANFLGQELVSFGNYHHRLLVVMPNGYGIYSDRDPTKADKRVLASLPKAGTRDDLSHAATEAVTRLAETSGTQVAVPPLQEPAGSGYSLVGREALALGAAVTFLALILGGFVAWRRIRARRSEG
jgi:hypothetical protein